MASVSNPVDSDLETFTGHEEGTTTPGGPSLSYTRLCDGAEGTCTDGTYDATNMDRIIYGSDGLCGEPLTADNPRPGMCDLLERIGPENVVVEYLYSGLGFATRPGGPVPTIRVSLKEIPFEFIFLGGLLGFDDIDIPSMASTITGEDMSRCYPRELTPPDCS
jgi:hypothetical protein